MGWLPGGSDKRHKTIPFLFLAGQKTHKRASQVALLVKKPSPSAGDIRDAGSIPGPGISSGGGHGNSLVFLPGQSHGQRNLVGYSPQGHKESDTTEVT